MILASRPGAASALAPDYADGRERVVRILVDEQVGVERSEALAVAWERLAELGGISRCEPGFWTEAAGWLIAASQLGLGDGEL